MSEAPLKHSREGVVRQQAQLGFAEDHLFLCQRFSVQDLAFRGENLGV